MPDPLVMAAGDIACDPEDPFFDGSYGTAANCKMRQTSDLVIAAGPTAVLTLGDNQYEDGALAKFQASYDPTWGRFKGITRPAIGNHEYGTPGATGYFAYFNGPGRGSGPAGPRGRGYYSFDIGAWHLISLNANCQLPEVVCGRGSRQERWLRRDLARHDRRCVLAYAGRPRFSSDQTGDYRPLKDMFSVLYEAGAELLVSGDVHNYERFAPQGPDGRLAPARGVRQFVVGTGGKNLSKFGGPTLPNSQSGNADSFGVLALRLHPRSYEWQFQSANSGFGDSGQQACH